MTGSLSFSNSRRGSRRWVRVVTFGLLGVLGVAAVVAAIGGTLWVYAWWRLGGTELPSLEQEAFGAAVPSAPDGVTTLLVALTEERDPTVPRDPALAGPVAIVQGGGARGDTAVVVLLPADLPVTADGEGTADLSQVHLEGGLDALTRAVVDYTEVRIDHAVAATTSALPRLLDTTGPLEVCDGGRCREVTAEDAGASVAELAALEPGQDGTAAVTEVFGLVRSLADAASVPSALRSPLVSRSLVDVVAGEFVTDVGLRGSGLLTVADHVEEVGEVVVLGLPALRNPDSGELLVLPEQAATRFAALREGGVPEAPEEDDATALLAGTEVAVLNGTGTDGFASRLRIRLEAEGVRVVGTGNAASFSDDAATVVRYGADDPATEAAAILLARALGDVEVVAENGPLNFEGETVDIIVVGGADLDQDAPDGGPPDVED